MRLRHTLPVLCTGLSTKILFNFHVISQLPERMIQRSLSWNVLHIQGARYSQYQRFSACYGLKIAPKRRESEKREEVQI